MRWNEITVHTTEEAVEVIADQMNMLGAGGVSIEESGTLNKTRDTTYGEWYELPLNDIPEGQAVLKGYFPVTSTTEPQELVQSLTVYMEKLVDFDIDAGNPIISVKEVDDEDWANAWKQYFKPVRITDKLTIKPTWEDYAPAPGEIIIELDPGMAFGTGTHATTSLCLKALEKVILSGDEVIDVGTGSGVLSIGAVKLGASRVLALDLDPVAVSSASINAEQNHLTDQIIVRLSDLLGVLQNSGEQDADVALAEIGVTLPVRVVVANILAEIIVRFVDDVYQALQPGGVYITSGIIKAKEKLVTDALGEAGFTIREVLHELDWVAIIAEKGR